MILPYTICFCIQEGRVLLLFRHKPPNAQHWNGLGGKLLADEAPLACIQREMIEEAEIDLQLASELRYAGIVTWTQQQEPERIKRGMYAFVAFFSPDSALERENYQSIEGLVKWHPLTWACDPHNQEVVSNIPQFLPAMLSTTIPMEYQCVYNGDELITLERHPLNPALHICL